MDQKKKPILPEDLTDIRLEDPAEYAAGPVAIKAAMDHLISEMGALRAFQAVNRMNKKGGFDCPGCAWPDPDDKRSVLGEYCENGAKALAEEATLKRVTPAFFQKHALSEMRSWSDYEIGKKGRLTAPMIVREGEEHYQTISWQEAFDLIAEQLRTSNNPDRAVFYTSGRSSNEAAYLYGLFARRLGTNNLPDCSNMCHESSGVALSRSLGIGKGSVTLDDLYKAEVIMIIGQNPGTNHPRMLSALEKAKQNGSKVITINPLEEAGLKRFRNPQQVSGFLTSGTQITDSFLQVRVNEDVALLKAIMKGLLEADAAKGDVLDHDFISRNTQGYQEVVQDLEKYTIPDLLERSGITKADFQEALNLLLPARRIIICWAMGLTQHKNGVENILECVNLLLMKGAVGKPGAGTCPVRGHSNVQGDRTVGINHHLSDRLAEKIKTEYRFTPPAKSGYDVVKALEAMHEGKVDVFMALGGNILTAAPDTEFVARALANCELTISVSTKLNRTHLHPGKTGLILPTLGRSEEDLTGGKKQMVSVENSMGKVHSSAGKLKPASDDLMSEPAIVCRLAEACFSGDDSIPWKKFEQDYQLIRTHIGKVVKGFENYNERIDGGKEFYLPNNARDGDFSKLPGGKAKFTVCGLPEHHLAKEEYLLTTIRSHDQFNTTIYGLNDRYRGVFNERRVVFMNVEDMERIGVKKLDLVDISSNYRGKTREVHRFHVIPYSIPRQNLAAYFPETNPLIPIHEYADHSQTPISKSVKVSVRKSKQ